MTLSETAVQLWSSYQKTSIDLLICSQTKSNLLLKNKKITINLANLYFVSVTFWTCFFSPFSSFIIKNVRYKYYNELLTTRNNGIVREQFHEQTEGKLNRIINANSSVHTLTHEKIIKSPFNKNSLATIKSKQRSYY